MKQLLDTKIFIGKVDDLIKIDNTEWAIVSATQTSHYKTFGWDHSANKPDKKHPNYIFYEKDNKLSLNWVDGGAFLYEWSGTETFIKILDFIEKWIKDRKVIIHCDQGESRSPTLGLLFLAKRLKIIPNDFLNAKKEFLKIYPAYRPAGIADYVAENWEKII